MSSTLPDTSVVSYNIGDRVLSTTTTHSEVQECHKQVDQLKCQVKKQQEELSQMKSEVDKTKQELTCTRHALRDVINTQRRAQSERNCLQKVVNKVSKQYEDTIADLLEVEDDLFRKNSELTETISSLQKGVKATI